jgi:predicted nucleic acid-binding protein
VTEHLHLIDSSIWVKLFRRGPDPNLAARVDELLTDRRVATNGLIQLEVVSGSRNETQFADFSSVLAALVQLAIDDATWSLACRLGYELRRQGFLVGSPDLIIAASAIAHDAVLLHADSDFDRIAANTKLLVESYAQPPI